jgi:hypothetical protein
MPSRQRQRQSSLPRPKPGQALFSAVSNAELSVNAALTRGATDRPVLLRDSFMAARKWSGVQGFIQSILKIRFAFYNFGWSVQPAGKVDEAKWQAWLTANRPVIQSYLRDAWLEWLTTDNVVALWVTGSAPRPVRVKPEDCQYADQFAREVLLYTHGLGPEEIKRLNLSGAQVKALEGGQLKLAKADASLFGFEVVKRAPVGEGLAWPGMQSVFLAASTHESLEVADAQLAFAMRRVFEQHKKGHETRYGLNSGSARNFVNDKYRETFQKSIKGKKGLVEILTNFDHDISWPRPDPKHFDAKRYGAVMEALVQWSMPIGHMLAANTIQPYLFEIFRELAGSERREYLAPHVEAVIQRTLRPPVPVRLCWEDSCFCDPRLRFDMLKAGLASGPLSQTTFLERIGESPERERKLKATEAELPKSQTWPIYDPAHGDPTSTGGSAGGERAGRKTGSPDNPAK